MNTQNVITIMCPYHAYNIFLHLSLFIPKVGPQWQKSLQSSRHLQEFVSTIGLVTGSVLLIRGAINIVCPKRVFLNMLDATFWNKIVLSVRFWHSMLSVVITIFRNYARNGTLAYNSKHYVVMSNRASVIAIWTAWVACTLPATRTKYRLAVITIRVITIMYRMLMAGRMNDQFWR